LDGLQLNPESRNDSANVVVRTDGSGYANFGWINTTSGNTTNTITDFYVNTNDGYIRKATKSHVASQLSGSTMNINGSSTSCTGNAASATKLATARTINGVSFDGTANITLPVSASFDAAHSFASSGYQKFSNGLIIQWGSATTGTTKTFPLAFPNVCASVTIAISTNTGSNESEYALSVTKTSFYPYNTPTGGRSCYFIAIGY
jgi:hypothetical protein